MQFQKIEVVPGLDDLAIFRSNNRQSGNLQRHVGRGKSQPVTRICAAHAATRSNSIAGGNRVFDSNNDIRKGLTKLCLKSAETSGAPQRLAALIRKTMLISKTTDSGKEVLPK
jgi:hypothetical protein